MKNKETLEEAAVRLVKETTLYGKQEASIGSSARSYFETELRCVLLGAKLQQEQDKELFNQETLEEFANKTYPFYGDVELREAIEFGAKWQQEQEKNKYSEKDIEEYGEYCTNHVLTTQIGNPYLSIKDWFKQFKKK